MELQADGRLGALYPSGAQPDWADALEPMCASVRPASLR